MDKTLLIFGISGFVGPYLAKEFFDAGYNVIGSDIVEPSFDIFPFSFVKTNILNACEVKKTIESIKPDLIINLAAISSVGQSWEMPQTTIEINTIGALNILEVSKNICPRPVVMFVGSSEEYGPSDAPLSERSELLSNNPYGVSKIAQENLAKTYRDRYGIKIFCVRSFNHTGIGQKEAFAIPNFCKQVAAIEKSGKGGTIKVGNLNAVRDFSDVKDIVRAYRMIIEKGDCNNIYNVGSGNAYSLKYLLQCIIAFSTQEITIEVDSTKFRPIDTPYVCCDNTLIKNQIGWQPKITIEETLLELFNFYKNN